MGNVKATNEDKEEEKKTGVGGSSTNEDGEKTEQKK